MSWIKSKLRFVATKASDAIAHAADIVAPTLYETRVEEFHHRWTIAKAFIETFQQKQFETTEQRRLLLDSNTREILQKMVLLIYAEENALDIVELNLVAQSASYDPWNVKNNKETTMESDIQIYQHRECLEYLLEKNVIQYICEVGKMDKPCGMMSISMQFIAALLNRVNYPILPTRNVHIAVVELLEAATQKEVDDPIVRKCLMQLLNVLWKKLRTDPVQTEFFFSRADRTFGLTNPASTDQDSSSSQVDSTDIGSELVLFTGLLPHMYAVGKIGEQCREALVIAASLNDNALCRFILQLTPFCHYSVNGLLSAYHALPKVVSSEPSKQIIPPASQTSGLQYNASTTHHRPKIENELCLLANRLHFCCTLTMVGMHQLQDTVKSSSSISHAVVLQFRTRFLEGPIVEALTSLSDAIATAGVLYTRIIIEEIASCGRDTSTNPLLSEMINFLLYHNVKQYVEHTVGLSDASKSPSTAQSLESTDDLVIALHVMLLNRLSAKSSALRIATMDLFAFLLDLNDESIDLALLGQYAINSDEVPTSNLEKNKQTNILSPRNAYIHGPIWFASHFPSSTVAAFAHLWKIQGFDSNMTAVEIPGSDGTDDSSKVLTSEDHVISLLSYIADAEYISCKAAILAEREDLMYDSAIESDADNQRKQQQTNVEASPHHQLRNLCLSFSIPSFTPVTSFLSEGSKPFRDASKMQNQQPLFIYMIFQFAASLTVNSFHENLALSGVISSLAQKQRGNCADRIVYGIPSKTTSEQDDKEEKIEEKDQNIRSILQKVYSDAFEKLKEVPEGEDRLLDLRRKAIRDGNHACLTSISKDEKQQSSLRLIAGIIILEEILKELCSLLFATQQINSLPVKPEGYYLDSTSSYKRTYSASLYNEETKEASGSPVDSDVVLEFEKFLAEAELNIISLTSNEHMNDLEEDQIEVDLNSLNISNDEKKNIMDKNAVIINSSILLEKPELNPQPNELGFEM